MTPPQVSVGDLDHTGKIVLDHIYNLDQPLAYYRAIDQLDYRLPQRAKPLFARILDFMQTHQRRSDFKIVDLGCSYGVNAALLKWGLDFATLIAHYRAAEAPSCDRDSLIRLDRQWLHRHVAEPYHFIGVDCAGNALDYAHEAGFLDGKVIANLEQGEPSETQRQLLRHADLIISTGCIGYVTEKSLAALLDAAHPRAPWMVHFVLRMFPFEPIGDMLHGRGYVTLKSHKPVRQRRFATPLEQERALERLAGLGVDTRGAEADGWLYADCFFSRPAGDAGSLLPDDLAHLFAN